MDANTFVDVIGYLGFALDKIEVITSQIDLTEEASQKILTAKTNIDETMNSLKKFFPTIKSIDNQIREELKNEFF